MVEEDRHDAQEQVHHAYNMNASHFVLGESRADVDVTTGRSQRRADEVFFGRIDHPQSVGAVFAFTADAKGFRVLEFGTLEPFYNVPARLKFLRSARAEWRAVAESLIATALCRRDLRLGVTNDGKSALTLPPASSMRAPSLPLCSTTEKLADAPGISAAMPMGVMLGNALTAARTETSVVLGRRSASSTPISNRMASTRK